MMSPLEYLFFAMMTSQQPDPVAVGGLEKIEPASGNATATSALIVSEDGYLRMPTILMEPRDAMTEKLEAPIRITPEWVPSFKIGAPMMVRIDETHEIFAAKVARIESITDEGGVSVQVIAEVPKSSPGLQAGMTAIATMTAPTSTR